LGGGVGLKVLLGFNVRRPPDRELMTLKFTKNMSYMIHHLPYHIIYSHVQTIAYL